MRDSQSLLEQLLAFSPGRITVADVHEMLGTAGEERLVVMLGHLVDRNPAAALAELDAALAAGVDVGQLIEQLFGCLRDAMVSVAGCGPEAFLYTSPSGAAARGGSRPTAGAGNAAGGDANSRSDALSRCATARRGEFWPSWRWSGSAGWRISTN